MERLDLDQVERIARKEIRQVSKKWIHAMHHDMNKAVERLTFIE
jgi:hypothetical protein